MITAQLTPDSPDNGVKHGHLQEQTARVFLVLGRIRGNLSSYINPAGVTDMKINRKTNQENYTTGGIS